MRIYKISMSMLCRKHAAVHAYIKPLTNLLLEYVFDLRNCLFACSRYNLFFWFCTISDFLQSQFVCMTQLHACCYLASPLHVVRPVSGNIKKSENTMIISYRLNMTFVKDDYMGKHIYTKQIYMSKMK